MLSEDDDRMGESEHGWITSYGWLVGYGNKIMGTWDREGNDQEEEGRMTKF